jgi:hypothetical protein
VANQLICSRYLWYDVISSKVTKLVFPVILPPTVIYTVLYRGAALSLVSPYPLAHLLSVTFAARLSVLWDSCKHDLGYTVLWDVS